MRPALWLFLPVLLFSCAHQGPRTTRTARLEPNAGPGRVCRPLTAAERQRVLAIADPDNFPHTRYRKGPNPHRGIEKETDCSHFVHEVYRRAGLPYHFRPTADLGNAREFDLLPEKDARPGDLMLFRGHVGIVDDEGKIISALNNHRHRKTSIHAIDRRYFRTFRGQRYVLRYRCPPRQTPLTAERRTASETRK
jgi:cell wall-associated NlpC family hydrolase